jgi:endonuclease/exonuclease/phosphatase family metal-dependent hydrolase
VGLPLADGGECLVANGHLPSSRQLPEEEAAARRIEELGAALTGRDRPQVVLGDFNEPPGGALGAFLRRQGYRDAAVETGNEARGTTPGGKRGDQIWVCETLAARISGYGVLSESRMRAEHLGKQHLSDHFPLWVDLDLELRR